MLMQKSNYQDDIDRVKNYVLNRTKIGDVISYNEIELEIGYEKNEYEFAYIVSKAKAELLTYGIVLKNLIGFGFKRLNENEIPDYIISRYLLNSIKKQEDGLNFIKYLNMGEFSKETKDKINGIETLIFKVNRNSVDEIMKSNLLLNKAKAKEIGG